MQIAGLQKLTLIDYPNKIACTIFSFGCNFRCGFCHNPELVISKPKVLFSEQEILSFLDKRKDQLEAVCFTGGEPLLTLKKDFVRSIKNMGYLIKIDTNGTNPKKLKEFINEKLCDFIAMDIKSSKEKYCEVANAKVNLGDVSQTIKMIVTSGVDYEFRTTIVKRYHNKNEIEKIGLQVVELLGKKPKKYVLQAFTNQGKFIDPSFETEPDTCKSYLLDLVAAANKYFEKVDIRV